MLKILTNYHENNAEMRLHTVRKKTLPSQRNIWSPKYTFNLMKREEKFQLPSVIYIDRQLSRQEKQCDKNNNYYHEQKHIRKSSKDYVKRLTSSGTHSLRSSHFTNLWLHLCHLFPFLMTVNKIDKRYRSDGSYNNHFPIFSLS